MENLGIPSLEKIEGTKSPMPSQESKAKTILDSAQERALELLRAENEGMTEEEEMEAREAMRKVVERDRETLEASIPHIDQTEIEGKPIDIRANHIVREAKELLRKGAN